RSVLIPSRSGACIRTKTGPSSAGFAVNRLTSTIVPNDSGTATAAGEPDIAAGHPPASSGEIPPNTETTVAPPATTPPATSPATAPAAVSPRHQIPSTSSGHRVDAASEKASPTVRDRSRETTDSDNASGTAPAASAA